MGDIYTNPPQSRNEAILRATIDNEAYTDPPQSRIEDLLLELKDAIEQGGGGGTTNYNNLSNKPQIADITLSGNKSLEDLGIASASDVPAAYTSDPEMNGTASAGSSTSFAKGDHVHPSDTSRAAQTEIDAMVNVYGSKNIWNIEGWLNKAGEQYTKISENVYFVSFTGASYNNPFQFSDTDIQITLSISDLAVSGMAVGAISILNSSNEVVGTISSDNFISSITCTGCKVRFEGEGIGTIAIDSPMIRDVRISDDTYVPYAMTNRELTGDKISVSTIKTIVANSATYADFRTAIAAL